MNNNIKKNLSNEKGITLVALMITVAVMIVIVAISVDIGTESLDSTRLQGFYMQLETIQKRADDIEISNETYSDSSGNTINIKDYEEYKLTESEKNILENILSAKGANLGIDIEDFRYFTVEELDIVLDLIEMDYNVFIHFPSRTVIAEKGITINGKTYYVLKNNIYFSEYNKDKNKGEITLEYDISTYGTDKYKISVEPSKVGDLATNGTLRYKKTTTKYWETADDLAIILEPNVEYNIEYIDVNKNTSGEKKIKIEYEKDEEGNLVLDAEGNNKVIVTEIIEE